VDEGELLDAYGIGEDTPGPATPVGAGVLDRIWRRTRRTHDGHWLWTGSRTTAGYPVLYDGTLVHRLIYGLAHDIDLTDEDFIIRVPTCPHRTCINPAHLARTDAAGRAKAATMMRRTNGVTYRATHEMKARRARAIATAIPYDPDAAAQVLHRFSTLVAARPTMVVHRHAMRDGDDSLE